MTLPLRDVNAATAAQFKGVLILLQDGALYTVTAVRQVAAYDWELILTPTEDA